MVQQVLDLALNTKTLLYTNWDLGTNLVKTLITWFPYMPTAIEVREHLISIGITYVSGSGNMSSQKVMQMQDVLKIDIYMVLRNLSGATERALVEADRMLIKDKIIQLIHDNQLGITGVKFGKYSRSARSDEVDSVDEKWVLHESVFIQCEWYQTKS